ncbi:hypothetical protein T439DRAFT_63694 [Meredithblackwellia eburnea MCA 4105]
MPYHDQSQEPRQTHWTSYLRLIQTESFDFLAAMAAKTGSANGSPQLFQSWKQLLAGVSSCYLECGGRTVACEGFFQEWDWEAGWRHRLPPGASLGECGGLDSLKAEAEITELLPLACMVLWCMADLVWVIEPSQEGIVVPLPGFRRRPKLYYQTTSKRIQFLFSVMNSFNN